MLSYSFNTPIGVVNVFETTLGVVRITFGKALLATEKPNALVVRAINAYLCGETEKVDVKADYSLLSPFQRQALRLVESIAYGQTRTYGQIAFELGGIRLSRAVGVACKFNPLPLVIPCHRVVGAKGLGGYNGGTDIKEYLLQLEQTKTSAR